MAAYVEHDFKKGFLLDEGRLRKVRELIEARISKFPTPLALRYKVFRGDSYSYETNSVEDVIREDNEDWRAVVKLELLASREHTFDFKLVFSDKGATLTIIGDDRDAIFLLFADLRDYIKNELLVAGPISKRSASTMGLTVGTAMLLGAMYSGVSTSVVLDHGLVANVLASGDLAEKINFLIEDRARTGGSLNTLWWSAGAFAVIILSSSGVVAWSWSRIFLSNLFLFGKRQEHFTRRTALLGSVFWIVVVGFLVSIIAGLIVWRVTGR